MNKPTGLIVWLICCTASGAGEPQYGKAEPLAELADRRITESSGVAVSRLSEGVIWMHNDSGDKPVLYATNEQGEALGRFEVTGAEATDWEDMCSFKLDDTAYLLVADCGNNGRNRDPLQLYLVPEKPVVKGEKVRLRAEQTIRYRFADGRHDCESIAFDPATRTIYLATKHFRQPGTHAKVYALKLPDEPTDRVHELEPVATLPTPVTMAMDLSPDGKYFAVLSGLKILLYERHEDQTWAQALRGEPAKLDLPAVRQFEALCFAADGRSLYLTSEGQPCPMWKYAYRPVNDE